MTSAKQQIRDILLGQLDFMELGGGTGHSGEMPTFDYYALDYLSNI